MVNKALHFLWHFLIQLAYTNAEDFLWLDACVGTVARAAAFHVLDRKLWFLHVCREESQCTSTRLQVPLFQWWPVPHSGNQGGHLQMPHVYHLLCCSFFNLLVPFTVHAFMSYILYWGPLVVQKPFLLGGRNISRQMHPNLDQKTASTSLALFQSGIEVIN